MENTNIVNFFENSENNWMTVAIEAVVPGDENNSHVQGEETNESGSSFAIETFQSESCGAPMENSNRFLLSNAETGRSPFCAENEDEENLRKLLKEFDLESVYEYLKAAQVTYRSLQFMQKEDMKEAIPPLGLRTEFLEKLFIWKKKKFGIDEGTMPMPSKVEDWLETVQYPTDTSLNISSANLSVSEKLLNKDLSVILNETSKGKNIIEFYKQKQNLTNEYMIELINIMVEEVINNNITLHAKDFLLLDNEMGAFPNEKTVKEYYFIPRQGRKNSSFKLYTKYKNRRSKKQKLMTDVVEKNSSETEKSTLLAFKTYLSRDSSDWSEVCEKSKLTFKMRQEDLSEMGSIEFFNSWSKLSDSRPPALIKIDFDLLYPSIAYILYLKWEDYKVNLMLYYESNIRNDFCRQTFSNAELTENKAFNKKSAILDAEETFALRLTSFNNYQRQIDEIFTKYYSAKLTVQPFLLVEGLSYEIEPRLRSKTENADIINKYMYLDKSSLTCTYII